jgi:phosphatidylinositol-3-phosphatase
MWTRRALVPLALLACTLTAGPAPAQTEPAGTRTPSSAARPPVTKLLVFVEENHSLAQMRTGMPYTFGLAERYGYATSYRALRHPSLPNYIAVAGGRMYGIHDDRGPETHPLTGRSVFGQALRHHKTAATYAEGMPASCSLTNHGRYAVRHNPWTYFTEERAACRKHDRSMAAFVTDVRTGRLPRVGMVVPNLCHDAHDTRDCDLATADAWFESVMARILRGPDWKAGRLAVVLTADEDDHTDGNRVLTTVIHPSQHHRVVTTPLNHYSLTRLYDEVAGLPYLHGAAAAPSIAKAFRLPLR